MTETVSREDYEAALECAVMYLTDPALAAGAGAEALDQCLARIRAYTAEPPAAQDEPGESAGHDPQLVERLETLQREIASRQPGDGIGPTLGMDLRAR